MRKNLLSKGSEGKSFQKVGTVWAKQRKFSTASYVRAKNSICGLLEYKGVRQHEG